MEATRVINIRSAPRGWENDPAFVYVGRPGKGQSGYFGNPIARGRICLVCSQVHDLAGDTLPCYRRWFHDRLAKDREFARRVAALRGKTLVCFCAPLPCHGEIIAAYVDSL